MENIRRDFMNVREYLKQLELLKIKIHKKERELEEVRELSQSVGGVNYQRERVQSSNVNSLENHVLKCIELEEEIKKEIEDFLYLQHEIINQIYCLTNPDYVHLLVMRYVELKKLEEISKIMNYSYQYIRELHTKALRNFEIEHKLA